MPKTEAERRALPIGVLREKCRKMDRNAVSVGGYVPAEPVLDEYSVYAAKAGGDAAIVIDLSLTDREKASFFSKLAGFLGIACVFQVHTFNQVLEAVSLGASVVQIPWAEGADILAKTVPEDVRCFMPAGMPLACMAGKKEAVPAF